MADHNNEDVFLAEKVVDSGFGQQDGKRYYKIKWVRYTWESEDTLGHLKNLLDVFWSEHERLDNAKNKQPQISIEIKEVQDKDNTNVDDPTKAAGVDDTLAGNAIVEDNNILETKYEVTSIHDTQISEAVTTLSTHSIIEQDQSIPSTLNPDDENFDEDNKDVKYIMLEKHTCNICLRTYSSLQSLKAHKRSHQHQADKTFQCETCFKCFSERSTLKRHMYIHLEEKPFKCEHCERSFSDKSTLRRHIITHTGAKRFHCTSCDKRFTRNEHLRQHNYIHTAEKLYKCEVCQKDFRQRSTLKNHMLLHRAEGGLKCEACGTIFSRQQQYDKHVRWCTGDTTQGYRCDFCDKRFPDRNGLKRHQLIHSGERPFKCDHCDQSFNDRSILRRHIFTHTERKPFQCTVCQKEFIRKASLLSHISAQHSDQSIFEFVQPTAYGINDNIPIEEEDLNQQVRFVIQTSPTLQVDERISQVEVSTNNFQNDGVTMLAHAVCNIPQDVIPQNNIQQDAIQQNNIPQDVIPQNNNPQDVIQNRQVTPPTGPNSDVKSEEVISQNQDVVVTSKNDNQTLSIHVSQNSRIHSTTDNQLLVQIVKLEDVNEFVQSIQAIVHEEERDCEPQQIPMNETQLMRSDDGLTSNTTESQHLSISETQVMDSLTISNNVNTTEPQQLSIGEMHAMDVLTMHSNVNTTESQHLPLSETQAMNVNDELTINNDVNTTETIPTHLHISESINIISTTDTNTCENFSENKLVEETTIDSTFVKGNDDDNIGIDEK